ncbi:MAG TPA: DUF3306 domain-containing protein [Bradyrhizobium sp.]|nr:DUF3306 domain-containing protein [Bradyrhizobium sp.]
MTERDNPLLRWSRLKQASQAGKQAAATSSDEFPAAEPSADAAGNEPFDPASLPSIDSIAADTDIIAFLRAGVPPELTRAALRRTWSSDPAIRDFIGIAENQWDFNDPNAIPGFGLLELAGNVADILSQASAGPGSIPDALALAPVETPRADTLVAEQSAADRPPAPCEPPSAIAEAAPGKMLEAHIEDNSAHLVEGYDAGRKHRHHGSALPR